MRIELQEPFASEYTCGYLGMKQGRMHITLYKWMGKGNKQKMERMLYARYLLSVQLRRRLTDTETVDHIDGDKTNDSIENLQLLTTTDHIKKHVDEKIATREHGTVRMYRAGCRCQACKAAYRPVANAWQKHWRDAHIDEVRAYKKVYRERQKNKTELPG